LTDESNPTLSQSNLELPGGRTTPCPGNHLSDTGKLRDLPYLPGTRAAPIEQSMKLELWQLQQRQGLPLEIKVRMTKHLIWQWYKYSQ